MSILGIILIAITTILLSDKIGWHPLVAIFPAIILVGFSLFLLNCLFNLALMIYSESSGFIKKIDRKIVIFGISAVLIICFYNTFFRYKYRTYKGNYNQVQVIKVDTLTGKSTVTFPEYVENNKK